MKYVLIIILAFYSTGRNPTSVVVEFETEAHCLSTLEHLMVQLHDEYVKASGCYGKGPTWPN